MGLVRLPCFFNCVQRIEKYSTTSSKMIKKWNGGHFFNSHNSKPWKQAPDLPIEFRSPLEQPGKPKCGKYYTKACLMTNLGETQLWAHECVVIEKLYRQKKLPQRRFDRQSVICVNFFIILSSPILRHRFYCLLSNHPK